jgi:hypothetical protein
VTVFVLWLLAFAAQVAALGSVLLTGASNLTVALALIATGVTLLALVAEGPPNQRDRRPW